jgi:hypothetical protein
LNTEDKKIEKNNPNKKLLILSESFLNDLDCLREMFDTIIPVLEQQDEQRKENINKIIKKAEQNKYPQTVGSETETEKEKVELSPDEYRELLLNLKKLRRSDQLFRQQIITTFIARFDEFIGELLKVALSINPEWLKTTEKSITYEKLIEMKSIDNAIVGVINEEIESLLRGSHQEQIEFIDKKLKIGIKENFSRLSDFLEIAERRNLIAHTGGKVSRQYLDKCQKFGHNHTKPPEIGTRLNIDDEYISHTFSVFFEIGLRISQGSYRRLFQNDIEEADRWLNHLAIRFLNQAEWELAERICEFDLSIPDKFKSTETEFKYYALINRAIAQKFQGKAFEEGLNGAPWAAFHPKYLLCLHVLKEKYDEAAELMKKSSIFEEIGKQGFRTWPVFRSFRNTSEFSAAYKEIFSEEYTINTDTDIKEIETYDGANEELC